MALSAADRVLGVAELLEHILLSLPKPDEFAPTIQLLALRRVNKFFLGNIDGSSRLKEKMTMPAQTPQEEDSTKRQEWRIPRAYIRHYGPDLYTTYVKWEAANTETSWTDTAKYYQSWQQILVNPPLESCVLFTDCAEWGDDLENWKYMDFQTGPATTWYDVAQWVKEVKCRRAEKYCAAPDAVKRVKEV